MTRAVQQRRAWLLILTIVPLLLVAMAYGWLAVANGTPWLWDTVVHESGHYTLAQTILFVRHFLREVPVDIAMALALAGAIRTVTPTGPRSDRRVFALAAVILVALAFIASAREEGWREAIRDLLQYRTRDDDLEYGSHWRFHLLSTVWFAAAAPVLAGITCGARGVGAPSGIARRLTIASWAWIVLLTILFGVGVDPFTSGRYIGHQAREIMTHGTLTLPLIFSLAVRWGAAAPPGSLPNAGVPLQVLGWVTVVSIPVFLLVAFGNTSLEGSAQLASGISGVVAAHVFEHVLDYLLVFFLAMALAGQGSFGVRDARHERARASWRAEDHSR